MKSSKTGQSITETRPQPGSLAVWWLGQSGYALKAPDGTILYIDPYISDTISTGYRPYIHARLLPPVVEGSDPVPVSAILYSHDHMDHFDPDSAVQLAWYTGAAFYGGSAVHRKARYCRIPEERMHEIQPGDVFSCGEFAVTVTPAIHCTGACGYVIEAEGLCLYFSGDTVLFYDMQEIGRRWDIDYAFLCFNGQGGNMDIRGCLCAVDMLHPAHVIPQHYGMYIDNSADPEKLEIALRERFPAVEFLPLQPGERTILP